MPTESSCASTGERDGFPPGQRHEIKTRRPTIVEQFRQRTRPRGIRL
jgi:hypothetical protein